MPIAIVAIERLRQFLLSDSAIAGAEFANLEIEATQPQIFLLKCRWLL